MSGQIGEALLMRSLGGESAGLDLLSSVVLLGGERSAGETSVVKSAGRVAIGGDGLGLHTGGTDDGRGWRSVVWGRGPVGIVEQ